VPHFAVCAVGSDQPGIVAAVTGMLVDRGCNLEDTQMAVLRGHFSMMLVVAAPGSTTAAGLEEALRSAGAQFDLVVAVRALDDAVPASPPGEAWEVSVYGADHPGIVHRVTSLLADAGANITSAETRVIGTDARPVYVMLLDVTVPPGETGSPGSAGAELTSRLAQLQTELAVDCTMRPAAADIF
jgi:glycine cleavage system transcriptional repressor